MSFFECHCGKVITRGHTCPKDLKYHFNDGKSGTNPTSMCVKCLHMQKKGDHKCTKKGSYSKTVLSLRDPDFICDHSQFLFGLKDDVDVDYNVLAGIAHALWRFQYFTPDRSIQRYLIESMNQKQVVGQIKLTYEKLCEMTICGNGFRDLLQIQAACLHHIINKKVVTMKDVDCINMEGFYDFQFDKMLLFEALGDVSRRCIFFSKETYEKLCQINGKLSKYTRELTPYFNKNCSSVELYLILKQELFQIITYFDSMNPYVQVNVLKHEKVLAIYDVMKWISNCTFICKVDFDMTKTQLLLWKRKFEEYYGRVKILKKSTQQKNTIFNYRVKVKAKNLPIIQKKDGQLMIEEEEEDQIIIIPRDVLKDPFHQLQLLRRIKQTYLARGNPILYSCFPGGKRIKSVLKLFPKIFDCFHSSFQVVKDYFPFELIMSFYNLSHLHIVQYCKQKAKTKLAFRDLYREITQELPQKQLLQSIKFVQPQADESYGRKERRFENIMLELEILTLLQSNERTKVNEITQINETDLMKVLGKYEQLFWINFQGKALQATILRLREYNSLQYILRVNEITQDELFKIVAENSMSLSTYIRNYRLLTGTTISMEFAETLLNQCVYKNFKSEQMLTRSIEIRESFQVWRQQTFYPSERRINLYKQIEERINTITQIDNKEVQYHCAFHQMQNFRAFWFKHLFWPLIMQPYLLKGFKRSEIQQFIPNESNQKQFLELSCVFLVKDRVQWERYLQIQQAQISQAIQTTYNQHYRYLIDVFGLFKTPIQLENQILSRLWIESNLKGHRYDIRDMFKKQPSELNQSQKLKFVREHMQRLYNQQVMGMAVNIIIGNINPELTAFKIKKKIKDRLQNISSVIQKQTVQQQKKQLQKINYIQQCKQKKIVYFQHYDQDRQYFTWDIRVIEQMNPLRQLEYYQNTRYICFRKFMSQYDRHPNRQQFKKLTILLASSIISDQRYFIRDQIVFSPNVNKMIELRQCKPQILAKLMDIGQQLEQINKAYFKLEYQHFKSNITTQSLRFWYIFPKKERLAKKSAFTWLPRWKLQDIKQSFSTVKQLTLMEYLELESKYPDVEVEYYLDGTYKVVIYNVFNDEFWNCLILSKDYNQKMYKKYIQFRVRPYSEDIPQFDLSELKKNRIKLRDYMHPWRYTPHLYCLYRNGYQGVAVSQNILRFDKLTKKTITQGRIVRMMQMQKEQLAQQIYNQLYGKPKPEKLRSKEDIQMRQYSLKYFMQQMNKAAFEKDLCIQEVYQDQNNFFPQVKPHQTFFEQDHNPALEVQDAQQVYQDNYDYEKWHQEKDCQANEQNQEKDCQANEQNQEKDCQANEMDEIQYYDYVFNNLYQSQIRQAENEKVQDIIENNQNQLKIGQDGLQIGQTIQEKKQDSIQMNVDEILFDQFSSLVIDPFAENKAEVQPEQKLFEHPKNHVFLFNQTTCNCGHEFRFDQTLFLQFCTNLRCSSFYKKNKQTPNDLHQGIFLPYSKDVFEMTFNLPPTLPNGYNNVEKIITDNGSKITQSILYGGKYFKQKIQVIGANQVGPRTAKKINFVKQNMNKITYKLKMTNNKGWGVFASKQIPSNTLIATYTGQAYFESQLPRQENDSRVTIGWADNQEIVMVPKKHANIGRYFNGVRGSQKPNLNVSWVLCEGQLQLLMITNKSISADEQICWDYGPGYYWGDLNSLKPGIYDLDYQKMKNCDVYINDQHVLKNDYMVDFECASVIKLLTSSVVFQLLPQLNLHLGSKITIQDINEMRNDTFTNFRLRNGQLWEIGDLLHVILLASACDAAEAIAIYIGRQLITDRKADRIYAISVFISKMRQLAKSIGMNIMIKDERGLSVETMSVKDAHKLLKYIKKHDEMIKIIETKVKNVRFVEHGFIGKRSVTSTNQRSILKGKTGLSLSGISSFVGMAKITEQIFAYVIMRVEGSKDADLLVAEKFMKMFQKKISEFEIANQIPIQGTITTNVDIGEVQQVQRFCETHRRTRSSKLRVKQL